MVRVRVRLRLGLGLGLGVSRIIYIRLSAGDPKGSAAGCRQAIHDVQSIRSLFQDQSNFNANTFQCKNYKKKT